MKPDEYQPLINQFESAVEELRAPKEHDLSAYLDYETTKKKIQSFQKNAADQLIQKLAKPLEESGASLFLQSIIKEGNPHFFEAIIDQDFEILNARADKTIIKGNNLANARFTKALSDIATDENFLDFYTFLQDLPATYFISIDDLAIAIPEPKTNPVVTSTKSATVEIREKPEATSELSPEKKEQWTKAIHNRGSADPHPHTKKVAKIFQQRRKASSEVRPPKELSITEIKTESTEIKTESKQTVEEQLDSLKRLLTENIIITPRNKIEERPRLLQLNVIIASLIKAPEWPKLFFECLSESKDSTIDDIVNLALKAISKNTTENKKEIKPEVIKQKIVEFFEGHAIRPNFTNFSLTSEDSRAALKTINDILKNRRSSLDPVHQDIFSDLFRSIKIDSDALTKLTKELEKKKDTGKLLLLIQNHNIPPNDRIKIIYPNLIKKAKDKKAQEIIINVLLNDLEIDLKKMQTRVLADLDKIKDFLSPEENKLIEGVKKEGRKISGDITHRSDREKKEFIQKMESGFQKSNEFPQTYAAQALIAEERFAYVFKSQERRATDQRNLGRVLQETYETRKNFSDFMGKLVKHFYDENWQFKPNLKQDGTALTQIQKDTLEKLLPPCIVLTKNLLGERNEDITKALNHAIDKMGDSQFREALKEAAANYNEFNKFVTEAKLAVKGDFAGLQLPDLIIMPIQQGPRLPLLMHETMKNSDPAGALYLKAKEGLGVAQKLAAEINQNVDKQIDKKPLFKQIDEKPLRNKLFMSIDITSTKLKESILYQLVKNQLDKLITTIAKEFNKLDLAKLYNFRHFYTILSQQTSAARALTYIESYDLATLKNEPLQQAIGALKTELAKAKEKELIMPTTNPKEIAPETAGLGTPTMDASTTTKTVTESKPVTIEPKSSPITTPPTISLEEFDTLSKISARLEPMDESKVDIKTITTKPAPSPIATPPAISQEELDKLSEISARLEPIDEKPKAGIKSSLRKQSVEIKHPFIMLPLPLAKNHQEQRMNDFVQFLQGAYMKFENKKLHTQSFTPTHKSTLIGNSIFTHPDLHAPAGAPSNAIKTPGKKK